MIEPKDFPKLESPFVRKEINGNYVAIPEIDKKYKWVFTEECEAVEKFDGTNVSVIVINGRPFGILNRTNEIDIWKKGNKKFFEGILEAIEKGYFRPSLLGDMQYFGELIGPKLNGNQYNLNTHLWLPFNYAKEHYRYKFWDDIIKELEGKSDEEIFNKVSEIFKGLWSLYKRKKGIKGDVNENLKFEGMSSEGIVFYRKGTNEMCKLRRDMFDWFAGRRH